MKLHKGINQTEIAVRYYERKGKKISREQAQKNFNLLRNPDITANAGITAVSTTPDLYP